MDSINAEHPVVFIHKLQSKCFLLVNLYAKLQFQTTITLVSQLCIPFTDPCFKGNGYYVQSLPIYVGASQTRTVNLNVTSRHCCCPAQVPFEGSFTRLSAAWVLTASSLQLPLLSNIALCWWELLGKEII